ncbi:hypothetical protein [Clostridium sp. FP1]|uniref:hypothetical protein n=1 Tax=Clostridium sp. FP1 TaxID=2724076 RepID=UPI0013E953DD|nr:hypothetical protein [Clostridium sp. FP1]MBZ9636602.1 hypothetical protein [Clostridium sp. FP1]
MSRTKQLKKNKLIWALIILLGALAIFSYIILYNGGVVLKKTTSTEVIDKLKNVQVKGGQFELTQKNIDELSSLYFAKPISKGNVTLTGVSVQIYNDEILIKAPISYKKINLLLSTKGKIDFSNGKITYTADNFKIGKLTLPKKLVMSQMLKLKNERIYVEDNLIKINPSIIPFKINSLKIKDNKILAVALTQGTKTSFAELDKMSEKEIDRQLASVKQKIQSATAFMNEAEKAKAKEIQGIIEEVKGKSIQEKKKAISDTIGQLNEAINKTTDSEKKKELEKIKAEAKRAENIAAEKEKKSQEQNQIRRVALTKAAQDLSGAYSQLETSKEKQIISIMQSTMDKMASDPSYNSSSEQASVKSMYSTLDSGSRNKVKYALASNVEGSNLQLLRDIFGV